MKQSTKTRILACLLLALGCEKGATSSVPPAAVQPSGRTNLQVSVDATGYHPSEVSAPAGEAVQLTMTRTSDEGCGQQVVFPTLDIRRDLPLNQPVQIDITMPASGSIAFTCGMDMMKGSIVAK